MPCKYNKCWYPINVNIRSWCFVNVTISKFIMADIFVFIWPKLLQGESEEKLKWCAQNVKAEAFVYCTSWLVYLVNVMQWNVSIICAKKSFLYFCISATPHPLSLGPLGLWICDTTFFLHMHWDRFLLSYNHSELFLTNNFMSSLSWSKELI